MKEYEHQIPSRQAIVDSLNAAPAPLSLEALGEQFDIRASQHLRALENRLKAMVRDGQLHRNRAGQFGLTQALELVTGKVQAHRDGYGFLIRDDGGEDVYLSGREMRPLFDGDRVAIRIVPGRRESVQGRVVEVLARAKTEIVGPFRRERGIGYVLEHGDSRTELLIGRGDTKRAKPGDIVRAEIIEYPSERGHAIGRVAEIIGGGDEPGIATDIAILAHGIPDEWPEAVERQLAEIPDHVPKSAQADRVDLRDLPLVTIDGADAKDFDDAVWCERRGEGFRLIVAIADVGHYVAPDSAIDREARIRGTSVYFPDRVVPMLPEKLSNGLCSLNPEVDRLCFACEMSVSKTGRVTKSEFFEAIMRSTARLTYPDAMAILDGDQKGKDAGRLRRTLTPLHEVYSAFAGARSKRGAIDFDLTESVIELDESGAVKSVRPLERLTSHRIIEECMIAANVEAAKRLGKVRLPGLYRVHEGPNPEKIEELALLLRSYGFKLPPLGKLEPAHFSRILTQVAGRPEAELIETMLLRSMSKALYQPKNAGHFGLSLDAYAHFTSPIRRYPDLLVHRALKFAARHKSPKGYTYSMDEMVHLGERCSTAERRADVAVWDVEEQLKVAYMEQHVGDEFDVIVASVAAFGLFVRIPELHVDGLVHVSALPPDYYHRDPSGTRLSGERGKREYRLLDRLRVRLQSVNLDQRKIDFIPVEQRPSSRRKEKRRG
ncbi:MAG TPA: ribonuclease R [Gammaproteobacteria bacterium]|nr:ribonuclease R [Gammaproteobacteria bacterium]